MWKDNSLNSCTTTTAIQYLATAIIGTWLGPVIAFAVDYHTICVDVGAIARGGIDIDACAIPMP
jgi:hypothetical protein